MLRSSMITLDYELVHNGCLLDLIVPLSSEGVGKFCEAADRFDLHEAMLTELYGCWD